MAFAHKKWPQRRAQNTKYMEDTGTWGIMEAWGQVTISRGTALSA